MRERFAFQHELTRWRRRTDARSRASPMRSRMTRRRVSAATADRTRDASPASRISRAAARCRAVGGDRAIKHRISICQREAASHRESPRRRAGRRSAPARRSRRPSTHRRVRQLVARPTPPRFHRFVRGRLRQLPRRREAEEAAPCRDIPPRYTANTPTIELEADPGRRQVHVGRFRDEETEHDHGERQSGGAAHRGQQQAFDRKELTHDPRPPGAPSATRTATSLRSAEGTRQQLIRRRWRTRSAARTRRPPGRSSADLRSPDHGVAAR